MTRSMNHRGSRTATAFRVVAFAAAAAALFAAGMAARRPSGDPDPAPVAAPPAGPIQASGAGPIRSTEGMPTGYSRSREGAVAAAVAYTTTASERLLYLDPERAERALRAIAADASGDALVADALAELARAREPLASGRGTTWWVVRPLAVKVGAYSHERARVAVWVVRVLSRQGVVVPQSSWSTETVELVWEQGDWKLWSSDAAPGPTPVLDGSDMPASAAALDAALQGFVSLPDATEVEA